MVVRLVSGDSERLLRNAHYLKLTGRADLALKELEEAYQQEPHNLKVVNALAQGYDKVGRWNGPRRSRGTANGEVG